MNLPVTLARLFATAAILLASSPIGAAPAAVKGSPAPRLKFVVSGAYELQGKTFRRYFYNVTNKASYKPNLFAASPDLPPCGANASASRTWVDLYDSKGKRLNGFCAFSKIEHLGCLWFALEEGEKPPRSVYAELLDRRTGKVYRSNLAPTAALAAAQTKTAKAAAERFARTERNCKSL